jgi:hypothetical protein
MFDQETNGIAINHEMTHSFSIPDIVKTLIEGRRRRRRNRAEMDLMFFDESRDGRQEMRIKSSKDRTNEHSSPNPERHSVADQEHDLTG